jgi:acetylglutamate kinase
LLNVNGDTAAGQIAASLNADRLVFLTDVPGLCDSSNKLIRRLSPDDARELLASGVASGGMAAKIEACLVALTAVPVTRIIDGRVPHALLREIEGKGDGTTIG